MTWWIVLTLSLLLGVALLLHRQKKSRVIPAIILAGASLLVSSTMAGLPWAATARAQSAPAAVPHINQLWQAQRELMANELGALQPRVAGRVNVYAIAVAAQGSLQLFSREAQLALQVAARRFGGDYRGGVFLSNALSDLAGHPLATQASIEAAARGIGERIDPARDLVVVYLTSHGSPEAWISTSLPNNMAFPPISSASLATALSQAGIKRRVVIVSACFSASWIPALASDDTIVITAAAKDRTSFGCDDSRYLTYFGEAFLEGPLARGVSLREAFEAARGKVAKWEANEQFIPSMPQASIGRNVQTLWTERSAARK
jgi:hypothetical protein